MPENILTVIAERHSYRGAYQNIPVPKEDLTKIMQAGVDAPSGCNKQTTSFIAVDDKTLLAQIASDMQAPSFLTAPAVILVFTEHTIAYADKSFYVQDYSAAIQNMLLAAKIFGYDSCWYEGRVTGVAGFADKMEQLLGVPSSMHLICALPIGVAAEEISAPVKKPFEARAWFNGYLK